MSQRTPPQMLNLCIYGSICTSETTYLSLNMMNRFRPCHFNSLLGTLPQLDFSRIPVLVILTLFLGRGSGKPLFQGEEAHLPPPSTSRNIKPIELKTSLKVNHDYTLIFYLKKSGKSMKSWTILLISQKISI